MTAGESYDKIHYKISSYIKYTFKTLKSPHKR